MVKTAPTSEQGSASGVPVLGLMTWAAMGLQQGNDLEYVPELMWPNSVLTYQKMRNDAQVDGLANGAILPITRWEWGLDQNNSDPAVFREAMRDFGLPAASRDANGWTIDDTSPIPRPAGRFIFHEHLSEALLFILYGHEYFNISGDLVSPPDDWPVDTPLRWRLRKLGPRPPWTITQINTDIDGGLHSIKQLNTPINDPGILAKDLLAYIWRKEGANWVGRSMLRSVYRPWLIKDRIMRVGAINIERNGAGVPIITAPPGATEGQIRILEDLARRVRGGDSSGGAIPHGSNMQLMGVIGSQPDSVDFMRFLNEEMARSFMQMVQQLGSTNTGSRALGRTFLQMMDWMLEAIADAVCSTFTNILIERWMEWNVGLIDDPNVDQFAPRLVYAKRGGPMDGLQTQVDNGNVQVDQQTQAMIEEPEAFEEQEDGSFARRTTSRRRAAGGHGGRGAERRAAGEVNVTDSPVPLPARPLSRQPNAHEIAATVDFATMDNTFQAALDLAFSDVRSLIRYQVDELHDAIVEADGDLDAISEISATPQHAEVIRSQLASVAERAATAAVQEASRQGVTVDRPNLDDLQASLASRSGILDTVITRRVTSAATQRAIRMTGGSLSPADVANQVRDELAGMKWIDVRDTLTGAVQGAQNSARALVFARDGQEGDLYASEILDDRTCDECQAVDGTNYQTVDDAERDYPFGGFVDCAGRDKCRGTLIKVYAKEVSDLG